MILLLSPVITFYKHWTTFAFQEHVCRGTSIHINIMYTDTKVEPCTNDMEQKARQLLSAMNNTNKTLQIQHDEHVQMDVHL